MWERRSNMPEIGDKICILRQISPAEPRATVMFMNVDVEHSHWRFVGKLQCLTDCLGAHHCADPRVIQVIVIIDRMEGSRQNQDAFVIERGDIARYKPNALGCEMVRPC